MFKICFVTTVSITLKSFVIELAKQMHETGDFEIHFVCDYDADFAASLPKYINYHPIPMKRGISFDGLKAICALKKLFKKEKFDLVQYSTPNASCYASIAAKMAKIPARLYCQWGIAYVGFSGLKRKIFKFIEKWVCKNSTHIEPDSFGNLNFSIKEGLYPPEKGAVIWNGSSCGIDLKKFDISKKVAFREEIRTKYKIPADAMVYMFVGRMNRDKGINELFEATKKIMDQKEDVYLLTVGDFENEQLLNPELLNWAQNAPRVIYCGFTQEVQKYLAATDVFVLPSYREGFPTSVLEAQAMGIPVVVTNIPGSINAMLKNETGLAVPKGDSAALCEAMLYLYEKSDVAIKYGEKGLEFSTTHFNQEELFKHIILDRQNILKTARNNNG